MIVFLLISIIAALGTFGLGFYVGIKHEKSKWFTYSQMREFQNPSEMDLASYFIEKNGFEVVKDGVLGNSTFYVVNDKDGKRVCRAVSGLLASKLLFTLNENVKDYIVVKGKITKP